MTEFIPWTSGVRGGLASVPTRSQKTVCPSAQTGRVKSIRIGQINAHAKRGQLVDHSQSNCVLRRSERALKKK